MANPTPLPPRTIALTSILSIIQTVLGYLETMPVVGADASLAAVFVGILQSALAAYHAAAGTPLDLSKIPLEVPVP